MLPWWATGIEETEEKQVKDKWSIKTSSFSGRVSKTKPLHKKCSRFLCFWITDSQNRKISCSDNGHETMEKWTTCSCSREWKKSEGKYGSSLPFPGTRCREDVENWGRAAATWWRHSGRRLSWMLQNGLQPFLLCLPCRALLQWADRHFTELQGLDKSWFTELGWAPVMKATSNPLHPLLLLPNVTDLRTPSCQHTSFPLSSWLGRWIMAPRVPGGRAKPRRGCSRAVLSCRTHGLHC